MKYILRLTIAPLVFFIFFIIIAMGIQALNAGDVLRVILGCLAFIMLVLCLGGIMLKEGEDAIKILLANDIQRREIIRTGRDVEINVSKEYRPWKGFIVGVIFCIPLVIFIILFATNGVQEGMLNFGKLTEVVYSPFYVLVGDFNKTTSLDVYIGAIFVLVCFPLMLGIPYVLGAHRRKNQTRIAEEMHKSIHGDV